MWCAEAAKCIISLFQSWDCKHHSNVSVKQLYLKRDKINVLREKPDGQRDCKNCRGPFGFIDKNRLLSFLIVCRNCRRAAAILTWGLPALGCAPSFQPRWLQLPFSLCCFFFSLSLFLPLSSFPVFLLTGRIIFPFFTKKTGQKERALLCGNTLVIFFALHQILFTSCHERNQ